MVLIKLKRSLIAFSVSIIAVMGFTTFLAPAPSVSAACDERAFLSFPTWYRGLPCDANGELNLKGENIGDDVIWPVVLNVTDILLQVAGMVAAFFVLWSGIRYMTSRGSPEITKNALMGLWQAAIGMFIAVLASTIVGFLVASITADINYDTSGVPPVQAVDIIGNGLNLLYWMAGIIAVAMILYSSFQYLTSKGFEDKTLKARRALFDAVIGLVIVLLAAVITNFIISAIT